MSKRFEFIEIREGNSGQVAYLLDTVRGVVVVAPVEFIGEDAVVEKRIHARVQPRYVDEEEYEEAPTHRQLPVVRTRRRVPIQEEVDPRDEIELPDPRDIPRQEIPKNVRAKDLNKSIVPPHLRGVFVKPGGKGADTETREA